MAARNSCCLLLRKVFRLSCVSSVYRNYVYRIDYRPPGTEPGKYPYFKRKVPKAGEASFAERMRDLTLGKVKYPDLSEPIDIGLPNLKSEQTGTVSRKKQISLEEKVKNPEIILPLNEVQEDWFNESAHRSVTTLAYHANIFQDLFHEPHFFYPRVPLDLFYVDQHEESNSDSGDEVFVLPVYYGNCIPAADTGQSPHLRFRAPHQLDRDSLWTLVMTCPDEHLEHQDKEYVHWMVANIPIGADGFSEIDAGENVCPYLPPIPPRGTGYHRYVFILYHQEKRVDLSSERRNERCLLSERTFSTYDFYREHQDVLTPAGLAFYQSAWDPSVKERFHHVLDMKEPAYEFEWPMEHREPQQKFPGGESFDKYLDKYRDVKDINEEVLKERLKLAHPFRDYPERLKYPMAVPFPDDMPTWLREREKQKRLRKGMWKDLP